jgi:ATP-dependent Clp protease protease subunit
MGTTLEDRKAEAEIDKLNAEIAKMEAERKALEAKEKADIEKAEAEADKARAEAEKATAEAAKVKHEAEASRIAAEKSQIELDRENHKRRKELAGDEFHYQYLFDKDVNDTSVKACIRQFAEWQRLADGKITVELSINSPGGSVFDGFALIDYIESMHAQGHTVNTTAYGMAASMAGVLLQVGKTRRMGANALVLIHEASFGAGGSMGKIEDQVKMVELMHDRILELLASRSKMTKTSIARRWRRRDWWINSVECLKNGFVDEIV